MSKYIPIPDKDGFIRGNKIIIINGVYSLVYDNSPDYLSKISSFIIKGEEPGFKTPDRKSFINSIIKKIKDLPISLSFLKLFRFDS